MIVDYVSKWVEVIPTTTDDAKWLYSSLGSTFLLELACSKLSLVISARPLPIGLLMLY